MASGCLARQIAEESSGKYASPFRDVVKVENQLVTLSHDVGAHRIKAFAEAQEVWPEPVIHAKVKDPDAEELDKLDTRKKDCFVFNMLVAQASLWLPHSNFLAYLSDQPYRVKSDATTGFDNA